MHSSDSEAWRAIDRGERPIDWAAWFGHSEGAEYLSDAGKDVARSAAADLAVFFGERWLDKAMRPTGPSGAQRIPSLGRFSPVFSMLPWPGRAGAYIEAVRWWASLQLLVKDNVSGIGTVRSAIRSDITVDRFLHTLVQARLAALGKYQGLHVVLEPEKDTGPGDVLLQAGQISAFVEVFTLATGSHFTTANQFLDQCTTHLHGLEFGKNLVYWEGELPGFLSDARYQAWIEETTNATGECRRTRQSVEVKAPDGRKLTVRPGKVPHGSRLVGEMVEKDQGRRLLATLKKKAAKTRDAGSAWIWAEDYGGIYPFTPFAELPLTGKIDELSDLVREVLADYPHVAGIVLSNVGRRRFPLPPDESFELPTGYGFLRGLPLDRVRETLIIPRRLILPDQSRLLVRLCREEPHWLDWALAELGINGGVQALLATPAAEASSPSLWIPNT